MTVGKYLEDQNSELEWLGMHGGQLGVRFPEVWTGVEIDCYDALGRLVCTQKLGNVVGENFIALPDSKGWLTIELRGLDGKWARWTGIL